MKLKSNVTCIAFTYLMPFFAKNETICFLPLFFKDIQSTNQQIRSMARHWWFPLRTIKSSRLHVIPRLLITSLHVTWITDNIIINTCVRCTSHGARRFSILNRGNTCEYCQARDIFKVEDSMHIYVHDRISLTAGIYRCSMHIWQEKPNLFEATLYRFTYTFSLSYTSVYNWRTYIHAFCNYTKLFVAFLAHTVTLEYARTAIYLETRFYITTPYISLTITMLLFRSV